MAKDKKAKKADKAAKPADDKAAKKAARMEALKNRPEGQRPNSKQIDIIETAGGTIETYAYSVRKTGAIVTTIAKDAEGNVVSTSTVFVPNVKAKSKKGHGTLIPGNAGEGKGKKGEDADEDDDDQDGDEAPAPEKEEKVSKKDKKSGKKSKKD